MFYIAQKNKEGKIIIMRQKKKRGPGRGGGGSCVCDEKLAKGVGVKALKFIVIYFEKKQHFFSFLIQILQFLHHLFEKINNEYFNKVSLGIIVREIESITVAYIGVMFQ